MAEDNIIYQKVTILNLRKLSHQVIVVSDGIQAVERVIFGLLELHLMDYLMRGMSGFETIGRIREWKIANKYKNLSQLMR